MLAVTVVDRDDGRVSATAEALDRAQRDLAVGSRLAGADAELRLERLDDLLRSAEGAGEVRADVDRVLPDGLEVEHVVEGRDRVAERRRHLERVGDLLERLPGEPAVALLCEPQRREHRRLRSLGIPRANLLDLVVQRAHRSVSPITASSEPTTAIMSAMIVFSRQVAVASSATNDGARKWTRHGFGPPSETR